MTSPKILVAEDNFLIALEVTEFVESCSCMVVGPVSSTNDAICISRDTEIAGAVLDVNLGNVRIWPVAEILDDRGIPFVLATGYDLDEIPPRFRSHPILTKPVTQVSIRDALVKIGVIPG